MENRRIPPRTGPRYIFPHIRRYVLFQMYLEGAITELLRDGIPAHRRQLLRRQVATTRAILCIGQWRRTPHNSDVFVDFLTRFAFLHAQLQRYR